MRVKKGQSGGRQKLKKRYLFISGHCPVTGSRSRQKNASRDGFVYYMFYRGKNCEADAPDGTIRIECNLERRFDRVAS